jgi:tRNA-Thr(GGU) m(6)t(6)A37 methyltransferase TsaA
MAERYRLRPIGVIHSPYTQPEGTPIQSGADDTAATVEVYRAYAAGLADLEGFKRIWLLAWYDRTKPYSLKVKPFMDSRPRGLFATRAPSRPNPIGLSLVKLAAVRDNILEVRGCDLLDGTPLLDIKPYAPQFDAFPDSRAGWLTGCDPKDAKADRRFQKPD